MLTNTNHWNLIEFRSVDKVYEVGTEQVHALRQVDLKIGKGDFVAIVSASGSGKSTCMNILGCLYVPTSGRYRFEGTEVRELSQDQRALLRWNYQGFVFQGTNLLERTTALENVGLPLIFHAFSTRSRRERPRACLDVVGLAGWENHTPLELSCAQQQRVAIARAMVSNPEILLIDEPTNKLDTAQGHEL